MSNIAIADLHPVDIESCQASESFVQELTEREIAGVLGGYDMVINYPGFQFSNLNPIIPIPQK